MKRSSTYNVFIRFEICYVVNFLKF